MSSIGEGTVTSLLSCVACRRLAASVKPVSDSLPSSKDLAGS